MIRLIATDLDDTILPEGTFDLNPEYFEVIRELKKRGILFVAASGRHSSSILRLFDRVKDDIAVLAGNGSCVMYQGKTLDTKQLDYSLFQEIACAMKKIDPHLILVDHAECVWTDSTREDLITWIRDGYKVRLERCANVEAVSAPVLKAAMHVEGDAAPCADRIREMIAGRANVMTAGVSWVDVVSYEADKGAALARIQKRFGISKEETAAFGDNGNDIGMLRLAGRSYAVANARPEVKEAADEVIGPMREDSVLKVMKGWLREALPCAVRDELANAVRARLQPLTAHNEEREAFRVSEGY